MADADVQIASPRAENATLDGQEPRVDASSTLRRSKRDSTVKSEPAKSPSSTQEETATSQQQRRSQRSVKSTYATASVAQKETLQRESVGKKTLPSTAVAVEKESEPPRRTRFTRGASVPVESSPPASPVKAEAVYAVSGVKALVAATAQQSGEALSGMEPVTPPRNRRPSRRQAEVDAGVASSPREQKHLILGAYTASAVTSLCEVIWLQIKENSYKADVLLKDRSPATIDWQRVAERLQSSHEVTLMPRECQRLWKFISYGKDVRDGGGDTEEAELLADSEPEEFEMSTEQVNARVKASHTEEPVAPGGDAAPEENPQPKSAVVDASVAETAVSVAAGPSEEQSTSEEPRETLRTNGIQLFPVYNQPSGVPDEWKKPFGLKEMMPLVFVAEKFLKRKAALAAAIADAATAAAMVTLSGEKAQPKPKRKRKSDVGIGADGEAAEKKPRKKKTPAVKPPATPSTAAATGVNASTLTPNAGGKSPAPLGSRLSYVPSSTPPPLPTAARSSFDFFRQMYNENPSIARVNVPPGIGSDSSGLLKDTAQFEVAFASAPQEVRTVCEQMAVDDQRRFDREQLRRRLWEKAMASLTNSPAPSPMPSAPSTPASTRVPVPVATSAASISIGDGTTSQISAPPSSS